MTGIPPGLGHCSTAAQAAQSQAASWTSQQFTPQETRAQARPRGANLECLVTAFYTKRKTGIATLELSATQFNSDALNHSK